jgi:hypothetical protein
MHAVTLAFVGILFLSISGSLWHEIIGEGVIGDTCLGTTNPYSTSITPMSCKALTNEDQTLHKISNNIIQFSLNLLHAIVGDLNIGKSASLVLFHRWSRGKFSPLRKYESHPETTLIHPYTGVSITVQRRERRMDDDNRWKINSATQNCIR